MNKDMNFDILGYKVKLKASEDEESINPKEVVDYVTHLCEQLQNKAPHLEKGQIAILVALQCAEQKLTLDRDFMEAVDRMQSTAKDALQFIEEVSPTTV